MDHRESLGEIERGVGGGVFEPTRGYSTTKLSNKRRALGEATSRSKWLECSSMIQTRLGKIELREYQLLLTESPKMYNPRSPVRRGLGTQQSVFWNVKSTQNERGGVGRRGFTASECPAHNLKAIREVAKMLL